MLGIDLLESVWIGLIQFTNSQPAVTLQEPTLLLSRRWGVLKLRFLETRRVSEGKTRIGVALAHASGFHFLAKTATVQLLNLGASPGRKLVDAKNEGNSVASAKTAEHDRFWIPIRP